jgi:hypothetical protein
MVVGTLRCAVCVAKGGAREKRKKTSLGKRNAARRHRAAALFSGARLDYSGLKKLTASESAYYHHTRALLSVPATLH